MVATLSSVTALTDARDKNTYAVARLADGECWMIENLRLDNTVSAATLAAGSQGIGAGFTKLPASEDTFGNTNTGNDLYSGLTSFTMPRINTSNTNANLTASHNASGYNSSWYSYGNYYSWPAAIASTANFTYTTVNTSICPAGWHLPFRINLGSFDYLNTLMGNGTYSEAMNKWLMFPNNFVLPGRGGNSRSVDGYYWGAASMDQYGTYSLNASSSSYSTGTFATARIIKYEPGSIRCVTSPLTSK